jgi:ABC-type sugar transport system ATPase subunit
MKVLFGIVRLMPAKSKLIRLASFIESPRHALSLGIGLVSQELSLVPQLDVAQNIFLGQTAGLDIVPRGRHREAAVEILQTLAPHLRVDTPVSKLGMADRQLVEISRTLARGGRIIAFDEPTSSLTPQERDGLFQVIRGLRDATGIIYFASWKNTRHHDRFTVMRDGKVV